MSYEYRSRVLLLHERETQRDHVVGGVSNLTLFLEPAAYKVLKEFM